jgi:hypothetical protein
VSFFDAGPTEENAGSITAYDAARPFSQANLRLAGLVQDDVVASLNAHGWGIPDDGCSEVSLGGPAMTETAADRHLLVLGPAMAGFFAAPSQMPGALIEPLFITDPFEEAVAASLTGQQAIAASLDLAVQQYFTTPGANRSATPWTFGGGRSLIDVDDPRGTEPGRDGASWRRAHLVG